MLCSLAAHSLQSDVCAPEVGGVFVVGEVLVTLHLLDALVAGSIRHQVPLDRRVLILALAAIQVPRVPDHKLKVVVFVHARAHVLVVVDEFVEGDLVVAAVRVPLCHELREDVILAHLSRLELGVLGHVIRRGDVVQFDEAAVIAVQLLVGKAHKAKSALVHFAANAAQELIIAHLTVIIFVEVLEDALELRGAKGVTVLTETPHELVAVHLAVTIVVHAAEDDAEATDAVSTTGLQGVEDLLEHLIGWLTLDAEHWVHVRVVSAALNGEPGGELLVVELVVAILVKLAEKGAQLELREGAAHGLEGLGELVELNRAEAVKVEMAEDLADNLALIVSTVRSLSCLVENDVFDLAEALRTHRNGCSLKTPSLQNREDEIVLLVDGGYGVDISVVANESILRNVAALNQPAHDLDKVVHDSLSLLLARRDTWVGRCVVL